MNIAWVSSSLPYLPARGGFAIYGANVLSRLSRRHSVDLVALCEREEQDQVQWARRYCNSVTVIPKWGVGIPRRVANFVSGYICGIYLNHRAQILAALRSGLRSGRWDVIHVEGGLAAGFMPTHVSAPPMLLCVHDAEALKAQEMLKCQSGLSKRSYYTIRKHYQRRYARIVYPRFARCVMVAERDAAFNHRLVPTGKFVVIPYGVDTAFYRDTGYTKEPGTVVFHGHLRYPPNVEAALDFVDTIFPGIRRERSDAAFHLVGADPAPEIRQLCSRAGLKLSANLSDLRAAISSAQIYVCPIRHGTGMKNKMLEAMALSMPIVCYPEAIVGINCESGKHVLVADNAEEFVRHVLRVLSDPEVAGRLATAGRKLVEAEYSWESRAEMFERVYEAIISERKTGCIAQQPIQPLTSNTQTESAARLQI